MSGESRRPRVVLASRIYLPEPAAASMRLAALVRALRASGSDVTVLTTNPPDCFDSVVPNHEGVEVRRTAALRDRDGYLRGYLPYLSFDVPLAFRLLVVPRPAVVVVEPPPTTGAIVRIICALRAIPYVYYAADIWSDAVLTTDAPPFVSLVLRRVERFAMRGAAQVLSASQELTDRIHEIEASDRVTTIGNGADTALFTAEGARHNEGVPYLLYAGTASEVHGATIFLDAFKLVLEELPSARIIFMGQGSDRQALKNSAEGLPAGAVRFEARLAPELAAEWMRGAAATLASVHPEGYRRAFATKMYASVACGTPVIYAGAGPGREFASRCGVGWAVEYSVPAVAAAMVGALATPYDDAGRKQLARWAESSISLSAVADRAVAVLGAVVERAPTGRN